jgi:uncharacterized protein YndB with AHSA1/START domain
MLRIEQTYNIKATPERVWAALTDPKLQAKWSGDSAEYDARVGGTYILFGDYVTGEIIEYDPPNKLAQTWKPSDWTIDDSVVTFTLTKSRGGTQLDLVHENVQPEDYDGTAQGWDEYYIGAIQKMLESEKRKARTKAVKKASKKVVGKKDTEAEHVRGAGKKKKATTRK